MKTFTVKYVVKGCWDCPRRTRMYRDKKKYGRLWGTHACKSFIPCKSLEIFTPEEIPMEYTPDWCPLKDFTGDYEKYLEKRRDWRIPNWDDPRL